jgi:hypothetical protein
MSGQMEEASGQVWEKVALLSCLVWAHHSRYLPVFSNMEAVQTQSSFFFLEALYTGMID